MLAKPESIKLHPGIVTDIMNLLGGYPYRNVADLIFTCNETVKGKDPEVQVDVPFDLVDRCYAMFASEPVVRMVKALEKAVAETQAAQKPATLKPVESQEES